MSGVVTIDQLSALVEDQYRLLAWLDDHRGELPAFDAFRPEGMTVEARLGAERWSITVIRDGLECCQRDAVRTVLLHHDHPSPFDFHPQALLRYVLSQDGGSRLNDIVIDNWITRFVLAGRLVASRHRSGYFTFA